MKTTAMILAAPENKWVQFHADHDGDEADDCFICLLDDMYTTPQGKGWANRLQACLQHMEETDA